MIKHIVMWRLKDYAEGNDKSKNALLVKEKLENLQGNIPGLIKIEVGINYLPSDSASDIVLYSEFESKESLEKYQVHPLHKEVMPFIMEVREERRSVDYEVF